MPAPTHDPKPPRSPQECDIAWMLADWLVRTALPEWLRSARLGDHALSLQCCVSLATPGTFAAMANFDGPEELPDAVFRADMLRTATSPIHLAHQAAVARDSEIFSCYKLDKLPATHLNAIRQAAAAAAKTGVGQVEWRELRLGGGADRGVLVQAAEAVKRCASIVAVQEIFRDDSERQAFTTDANARTAAGMVLDPTVRELTRGLGNLVGHIASVCATDDEG